MNDNSPQPADPEHRQKLMEKFGIRHSMADVFYYRDYRYGRFEDAVAQAMRDEQKP